MKVVGRVIKDLDFPWDVELDDAPDGGTHVDDMHD